ncbi:acyl carrier protein [Streptomyces sp. SudanB182_2057]|uniref:acyl carrier protein n=1 Tax=Streptomyces sp. SudanB182_2057 TaxID=3035281 RepID=UPI003F56BB57
MTEQEIKDALEKFITEEFLQGGQEVSLTEETPLVESGVLDSLRVAVLLGFIRDNLGAAIPLARIDAHTFADIRSIARAVVEASSVAAGEGAAG